MSASSLTTVVGNAKLFLFRIPTGTGKFRNLDALLVYVNNSRPKMNVHS
jgi:hypothetical protein